MITWFSRILLFTSILLTSVLAHAEEVTREQIKGLDEQVQEIKSDVLAIAAELNQLEEKLLYPSGTQVAMFVSLTGDDSFRLDSIEVKVDGEPVAYHLYSFKELQALKHGGVQRIYTGNLQTGDHEVQVHMKGMTKNDNDVKTSETFMIQKSVRPKAIEFALAQPGSAEETIELKEL